MNSFSAPLLPHCHNEWAPLEEIARQIRSMFLGLTTPAEPVLIKYVAQVTNLEYWPRGPALVFAEPESKTAKRLHVCSLNEGRLKEVFHIECIGEEARLNQCGQWLELALNQYFIKPC